MDVTSPETWRWIWLAAAALFAVGEIAVVGTFFLLSFAIGAAAAAVVAFAGGGLVFEWIVFVVASGVSVGALRPIAKRLDRHEEHPVGAHRWEGRLATVVADIPAGLHETGVVRIDREEWRAESVNAVPVRAGATVLVTSVAGTRLVVRPWRFDFTSRPSPPGRPEADSRPPSPGAS